MFADPKDVVLPDTFQSCSVEDMRIFRHGGANLCCFTLAGQTEKGWIGKMILAEISESRRLNWTIELDSPKGQTIEKNWAFFSCDDRLFCVYYTSPHIVYEVDLSSPEPKMASCWEAENWQKSWFMENARGGSPPVRVNNEFYHFYHTQHRHGRGVAYQTGLYTFDVKPPFNIKRIVKGPLLGLVPSNRPVDVLFSMGAFVENGRWNLSCGLMDQETIGISLGFDDVERMLEKAPSE